MIVGNGNGIASSEPSPLHRHPPLNPRSLDGIRDKHVFVVMLPRYAPLPVFRRSVSTTTPELSSCDKIRRKGIFGTAHHYMSFVGYARLSTIGGREVLDRQLVALPGRRLRTRVRRSCLRRDIRSAEPHNLPRLPTPQRRPRRPRARSARPPRGRAHLRHRRAQRARHRIPR